MAEQEKPKHIIIPIIICTIASFFYVYDYILRVIPEAMTNVLMRAFNIHAANFGILASLFFWGYSPMQIPCGMLYDRFSARSILTITVLCSALATLGFAFTDSFVVASLYRFIMGFMSSFAFVGALVVGATWFRGQYFALYTGLVQFLGCMGAIIGITPVALLTFHLGWRHATLWIAIVGIVLAALMFLVIKDAPNTNPELKTYPAKAYRKAFTHAQTWWVALFGFAIWSPIVVFAATWGVNYLEQTYNLERNIAGNYISTIWWTIAFGGPIVGWVSKHLRNRRWPMRICALFGFISAMIIIFIPTLSHTEIILTLVGYGIGASALVIAFGLIVDLQPPEAVGAIVGFTNMAVIFGGIVWIPTVGFIIQSLWDGSTAYGFPVYSHNDYQVALLMIPASFLLAFILSFVIKETHCEKVHEY